jgi:hypothetical protein
VEDPNDLVQSLKLDGHCPASVTAVNRIDQLIEACIDLRNRTTELLRNLANTHTRNAQRQNFIGIVQAPHCTMPQLNLVPVSPS